MIRKKEIDFKLFQLNRFTDQELFDQMASSLDLSACRCPLCGKKGTFHKITSYGRDMISVREHSRTETRVSVPRAICLSCGHTQSFLPDNLIPFSSYTLRFVLSVLSDYLSSDRPAVKDLCSFWQIAVSTLYVWIHLFEDHAALWLGALPDKCGLSSQLFYFIIDIVAFPFGFLQKTGFSFLQRSGRGTSLLPPFTG